MRNRLCGVICVLPRIPERFGVTLFKMTRHVRCICASLCLALPALWAAADAGWILTTADLHQQTVALEQIGPEGARVRPVGAAQPLTIPYDSLLQIDRTSPSQPGGATFSLILLNGDRMAGRPMSVKDELLTWHSPLLGQMTVPLKRIRALVRGGTVLDDLDKPPSEDVIRLGNGDTTKGIVTDLSETKIAIQTTSPIEIPLETVRWVQFALAAKPTPLSERVFRVRLSDDSLISATSIVVHDERINLVLPDAPSREIPLAAAVGIEQLNGPVSWLSSREPLQVVQIPFFGGVPWPTRMDATVGGKPIQFNDRVYRRGIGVHAYSRIEYALDGTYEAFRTQYAVAQEEKRQFANVAVRIKIDGKTVHERASVGPDQLSGVVVLDLPRDAKRLVLEVDYGQANDTQDRFNWIEPALLRKRPARIELTSPNAQAVGVRVWPGRG